jgi:hypothetical protein
MMIETIASSSVTGSAAPMSELTDVRDESETPRFPVSTDASQDPYWRKKGSPTP